MRKRGTHVAQYCTLASGTRGPAFHLDFWPGKVAASKHTGMCRKTLFVGMTLCKCAILWIWTLSGGPLCRESLVTIKNPTLI